MAEEGLAKPVRLADLAKAAGVSKGTASNVFNRPAIVRQEVRQHVLDVARSIGYRGPDPKGRLLSAGKVNAIGVATTEELSYFFTDPFNRVLMTAIAESCGQQGVGISLVSAANSQELVWNIRNAVVDGFILLCLEGDDKLIELSRERSIPFVALDVSKNDQDISAIGVDNVAAAKAAAEYLAGLGHRRFAILTMELGDGETPSPITSARIGNALYQTTVDRLTGYLEGLRTHGIDPAKVSVYETFNDADTVTDAMEALFSAPIAPTAILAQSDRIALYALDWLKKRNIPVPEQVSIIGFDGIPETINSQPALTTVVQPIAEIGHKAVKILLERQDIVVREMMATELVIRDSTAGPPIGCAMRWL